VIGADELSQILGVESRRQRRRADEIAEHHGQLPPLGLARRGWGDGATRYGRRQGSDRFEQPTPMTDRDDTHLPQVVGGELWQGLPVDLVFDEGLRVPPEAEAV
jgi:hypothetical protein